MIRIQLDPNARRVAQRLVLVSEALNDMRPLAGPLRSIFLSFMRRHFSSRGSYARVPWVPLSPRYAAWKARHFPGKPIMRLRDVLYGSLTQTGHPMAVNTVTRRRIEFGTRVPYARAHQHGVPGRLPQRVVIPAPTKVEGEQIADAVLAYLLRAYRGQR